MNTAKLRSKRFIIPTIAAVAVIGIGGTVWATSASANDLNGSERDRVGTAATQAVGGGTVIDAESSDDAGEAYEVEVRLKDGREVDVTLDEKLDVIRKDYDDDRRQSAGTSGNETKGIDTNDVDDNDADDTRDDNDTRDADDANDKPDADDRALSASERTSAERAAKAAVGGGTIVDVDASDDRGVAYEVEVRTADNTEWNVDLDTKFKVLHKAIDR